MGPQAPPVVLRGHAGVVGGEPRDLLAAMRRRRILRLLLVVLFLAASAWGLWCWVLATEYIVDYRGEEMSVGLFNVLAALGVWAVLILAMVATWRALNRKWLG
jgi:hypothetical protein